MQEKKRQIPRTAEEMNELLKINLTKAAEASKALDPVNAAYMAGRLDGMLDAIWIKEQSA